MPGGQVRRSGVGRKNEGLREKRLCPVVCIWAAIRSTRWHFGEAASCEQALKGAIACAGPLCGVWPTQPRRVVGESQCVSVRTGQEMDCISPQK